MSLKRPIWIGLVIALMLSLVVIPALAEQDSVDDGSSCPTIDTLQDEQNCVEESSPCSEVDIPQDEQDCVDECNPCPPADTPEQDCVDECNPCPPADTPEQDCVDECSPCPPADTPQQDCADECSPCPPADIPQDEQDCPCEPSSQCDEVDHSETCCLPELIDNMKDLTVAVVGSAKEITCDLVNPPGAYNDGECGCGREGIKAWEYEGIIDPGIPPTSLAKPSCFHDLGKEFSSDMYAAIDASDGWSAVTKDSVGPSVHFFQAQMCGDGVSYDALVVWEGYSDDFRNTGLYVWNPDKHLWRIMDKTWIPETNLRHDDDTLGFMVKAETWDQFVDENGMLNFMARSMMSEIGKDHILTDYVGVIPVGCGNVLTLDGANGTGWKYRGIMNPTSMAGKHLPPTFYQDFAFDEYEVAKASVSDNERVITAGLLGPSLHAFEFVVGSDPGDVYIEWEGYSDNLRNSRLLVWNTKWHTWIPVETTLIPETHIGSKCLGDDDVLDYVISQEKYADYVDCDGKIHFMAESRPSHLGIQTISTDNVVVVKAPVPTSPCSVCQAAPCGPVEETECEE
ncbi:MAG: hypothetical protein SVY53_02700 [Chloroflexota bacterium]|nr:hypothetical protein [Chloroflexota bacterium]